MQKVLTSDGSYTLFSPTYQQHYHNPDDGAIKESLYKHVIPAFEHHKDKEELHILDICFGLGYNTFTTLYWLKKNLTCKKLYFYSPELDKELIESLKDFPYPKEFDFLKPVIQELSKNHFYQDENLQITIAIEDARKYIKKLPQMDIVYQDAFSSDVNHKLWTKEYFSEIKNILHVKGILTTYSIATPVRMGLHVNDFYLYEYRNTLSRRGTLGFLEPQNLNGFIDMELKQLRNKEAKPFFDKYQ